MSARKPPTFSKPSPFKLPSPQGKIPASGPEGRKSGAHAEDGRFQPAADLRLSIVDCRLAKCPPMRRLTNTLVKTCRPEGRRYISVRNGVLTHRDVKNEGTSGDVYENKGRATKCTHINTAFYTKMHQFRDNGRQSIGLFGRKCIGCVIIRGEVEPLESALRRAKGRQGVLLGERCPKSVRALLSGRGGRNCWRPRVAGRSTSCWCGGWIAGAGR